MYKILTIGGEDYKLEYTIEAALYSDCVAKLSKFLTNMGQAENEKDIEKLLDGVSNIPQTALTIFYAGLMEAHGTHADGDGKVPDIQTAKRLLAQYAKEHTEDDRGNFYGILETCIEQKGEDDFFKLVGLDRIVAAGQKKVKKAPKAPQDHLRKVSDQ